MRCDSDCQCPSFHEWTVGYQLEMSANMEENVVRSVEFRIIYKLTSKCHLSNPEENPHPILSLWHVILVSLLHH